jgi:hypothetical protein
MLPAIIMVGGEEGERFALSTGSTCFSRGCPTRVSQRRFARRGAAVRCYRIVRGNNNGKGELDMTSDFGTHLHVVREVQAVLRRRRRLSRRRATCDMCENATVSGMSSRNRTFYRTRQSLQNRSIRFARANARIWCIVSVTFGTFKSCRDCEGALTEDDERCREGGGGRPHVL